MHLVSLNEIFRVGMRGLMCDLRLLKPTHVTLPPLKTELALDDYAGAMKSLKEYMDLFPRVPTTFSC